MEPTDTGHTGSWWHEAGFWYGLHTLLDPVRVPFFRVVLSGHRHEARRVLDVGSGAGFVAVGLANTAHIIAVDRSSEAVAEARDAGVLVAAADAARLPFADATFDAVICSEVLEHVADPERAVAEAARVTVHGGLFLFSTPARTLWSRLALIEAGQHWRLTRVLPTDLHDWGHFLTRAELEDLLYRNGFQIRRIAGIGIRVRSSPRVLATLALLKLGRIGYAEAGRRIHLVVTKSTRLAMIGYAERVR
ncbi:MAG: class I SAM-dependent methyltransferase [Acidimicrobiia bacterium]